QPEKKEADAEDQESQDAEQPDDPVAHTLVALHQSVRRRFVDIAAFDNWLQQLHNQRTFLIQQGIDLLPYQDAVVDLRTIAQRNKKGRWEVTGMFAKQAPPGLAVTNVKAGGRAMHVNEYFRGVGLDDEQQFQVKRELERLSLQIVEVFGRHYGNRLYGLDIGLDRNGKLWLIEINTRPSVLILKQIDRQMYRRSARLRWPQGRGT
ncbi:MAG TPA: YheC/YheD family protein, partial [Bacilli bacterium]|nr:YheC/YheD family protein [Bacilli bacterium]